MKLTDDENSVIVLKGRVIYLPYTVEKMLPLLNSEFLDKLIEAETNVRTLSVSPPSG
jgi:hypothetical protein